MNDEDKRVMDELGITSETKVIYHFEGHRYERLADAVNYAKRLSRAKPSAERQGSA